MMVLLSAYPPFLPLLTILDSPFLNLHIVVKKIMTVKDHDLIINSIYKNGSVDEDKYLIYHVINKNKL
jgi:hypothetical protein